MLTLKKRLLRSGDTLSSKELDQFGRKEEAKKEELEYYKKSMRIKVTDLLTTMMDI